MSRYLDKKRKDIYLSPAQHAKIKEIAQKNGRTIVSQLSILADEWIEGLNKEMEDISITTKADSRAVGEKVSQIKDIQGDDYWVKYVSSELNNIDRTFESEKLTELYDLILNVNDLSKKNKDILLNKIKFG